MHYNRITQNNLSDNEMYERLTEIFQKYKMQIAYTVLFALAAIFVYANNSYTYFWFDEGYTIALINKGYSDIWHMTAQDVHPPLYYFMLKAYSSLFGSSILSLRFFSGIPVFLIVLAGCTIIRKLWDDKTAIAFIVVALLSYHVYAASEIRMYSWSMLFVLMAFLYAYKAVRCGTKKDYVLFTIFSLAAGYSHYYALITVCYIYLLLFILSVCYDRKKMVSVVASGVIFLLGYLPWLLIFLQRVKSVTEDYWIDEFNPMMMFAESLNVFSTLKYTSLNHLYNPVIEWGVLILLTVFLLVSVLRNAKKKERVELLLIFSVFLAPLLIGIGYSYFVKPVFVSRYVCCFASIYFLVIAIAFSYVDFSKRRNLVLVILFFCFYVLIGAVGFYHKVRVRKDCSIGLNSISLYVKENLDDNTAFLSRDSLFFSLAIYPTLFPDNEHISKWDSLSVKDRVVVDVFKHTQINDYKDIDPKYTRLYVMGHFPVMGKGANMLRNKEDSLELDKYFEIARKTNINDFDIFELRRR